MRYLSFYQKYFPIRPGFHKGNVICPFHRDTNPSLSIDCDTGLWYCYGCGEGGDAHRFYMKYHETSFNEAKREIGEVSDVSFEKKQEEPKFPEIKIPSNLIPATESKRALYFLRSRGFGEQEVEDWDLRYADHFTYNNRRYKFRLFIPIYFQGKMVAFQARDVTDRQREKYLTSPLGEDSQKPVYNADRVDPGLVVVTEGVMDCWAVGKEHGVGLFGKEISSFQIKVLYEVIGAKRVVVAEDGDAYGKGEEIAADLKGVIPDRSVLEMPHGEDPASLGRKRVWEMINELN